MKPDPNLALHLSDALLSKAVPRLKVRWESNPADWPSGLELGETLRQLGWLDEALEAYRAVLAVNPACLLAGRLVSILVGQEAGSPGDLGVAPVAFVREEQFLDTSLLHKVWACIADNEAEFTPAEIAAGLDLNVRKSFVIYEDRLGTIKDEVMNCVLPAVERAWSRLGMKPFRIAGDELQLTCHRHGEFYQAHADAHAGSDTATRTITFVIYLFREPKSFTGGDLILYDAAQSGFGRSRRFTRIAPRNNSLLLFPSSALHQVAAVNGAARGFDSGRFTLNGWLHRLESEPGY